jgi:hypothetical protein
VNRDDIVRAFGMSGLQLQTDLRELSTKFEYPIVETEAPVRERGDGYFANFEFEVKREAARMARHYEVFYCLEKTIRRFITDLMEGAKGPAWWTTAVPIGVQDSAKGNMKREMEAAVTARSDFAIDYITFGELGQIISANWDVFGGTFESPKAVERVLAQLNLLRGPIAHCSPLAADEIVRLDLAVRDWFRLFE